MPRNRQCDVARDCRGFAAHRYNVSLRDIGRLRVLITTGFVAVSLLLSQTTISYGQNPGDDSSNAAADTSDPNLGPPLPKSFEAKGLALPEMQINKPLMTFEESEQYRTKKSQKFYKALSGRANMATSKDFGETTVSASIRPPPCSANCRTESI